MALIYVTRQIREAGLTKLRAAGHEVVVSDKDGVLTKNELLSAVSARPYDALVSLLTDQIDESVFAVAPQLKIVSNYAVGYNNINVADAAARNIIITNTPGVLTNSVAEFTMALILAITKRISESDRFTRAGLFDGWSPELLLGTDVRGKTLGIVGAGRIGAEVAAAAHFGFGMQILYQDMAQSAALEARVPATFVSDLDTLLRTADVVTLHVPLVPATQHLITAERLAMMKPSAFLINTARGPVVDEAALITALEQNVIAGAALDVFEAEPTINPALLRLDNVIATPHIASASAETRDMMSDIVAGDIIAFFEGNVPEHQVKE